MNNRRRNQRRGIVAEYLALVYLMLKGYRPVAMRYKTPVGEVDLVVRKGSTLVFVEVKARKTRDAAAMAIHGKNQLRVVRAAQYFLAAHPDMATLQVRFDVCLIAWYRMPHHMPHAFDAQAI